MYFLTIINPLLLISYFVGHPIIQSYLFTELFGEQHVRGGFLRPRTYIQVCYSTVRNLLLVSYIIYDQFMQVVFTPVLSSHRCSA